MTDSISRRSFLGTGLVLLTGVGAAVSGCATEESPQREVRSLPDPMVTEDYVVYQDLAYAAPVGEGHLLDLYMPHDATWSVPVVIHQLGSAFRSDDSKGEALAAEAPPAPPVPPPPADPALPDAPIAPAELSGMVGPREIARKWVRHGYAVVGLNVRNSSQTKFPGQLHDVKAAIRFLRANAGAYGLDSTRFAIMGSSSGAWVATMAALTADIPEFEGDLGNPGWSSAVRAVIDLYGPTDFLAMDSHALPGEATHDAADSPESELMGFPIQSDPAAVAAANPARYVHADSPPAYIVHGAADPYVPVNQSEILFDAYMRAGGTASLTVVPGVGHTDAYLDSPGHSEGRTVRATANGVTTTSDGPAPTFHSLLEFLDTNLRVDRPVGGSGTPG